MSFYQEIRTAKAAAIGTIMPFTGNISDVPDGWIPCDGSLIAAADFPLLARAIGDTYNLSTGVTDGLIATFSSNAVTEAGRVPSTYIYAPLDGSGGGASFAIVVADAGTEGGGAPSGVGGSVTITRLTQGINYVPTDTLTIPSGQSGGGSDITITVLTVEQGDVSTFGGEFPNYTGEIVLPNLINKPIVDMEINYFGTGGSSALEKDAANDASLRDITPFTDPVTIAEVVPYIGANADSGVPTTFNDVATDVIFELNERTTFDAGGGEVGYYYTGKVQGNTISEGSGEGNKVIFFGPRKLGRSHLKSHRHSGKFQSVAKVPTTQPGEGVIPWSNVGFSFRASFDRQDGNIFITNDDTVILEWEMDNWERGRSGFGGGLDSRTVAAVRAENPPVNWTPQSVVWSPIKSELTQPHNHRNFNNLDTSNSKIKGMISGGIAGFTKGQADARTVQFGISGSDVSIPQGYTNFYPDLLEYEGKTTANANLTAMSNPTQFQSSLMGTLNSNRGWDFLVKTPGEPDEIQPHTHDEVDIDFQLSGMRPLNSLEVYVEAPNPDTTSGFLRGIQLDNARNRGVFQINFVNTQPQMTCIHCIRAY